MFYEWLFGTFEKRAPDNVSRALLLHVRKVKFVTAMTNEPARLSSRSRYRDAGILANHAENFFHVCVHRFAALAISEHLFQLFSKKTLQIRRVFKP